ncbi:hypothetical protein Dsin_007016 [Dipteronia sinensis]|uniref:Reverse transcriptase zinc-binding domain-containing protein n=1 Tax=Dipteronia sinensis TaxID=43782 RepID=A0AAE0EGF8_9ROSI|nr:hypothetical protein Dsin_007016 [Dipteronia sinensis]
MKVLSKMKLFIWRAFHEWVPATNNLAKRGMKVDNSCSLCQARYESTIHALWCCPSLEHVRAICLALYGIRVPNHSLFIDFMILCMNQLLVKDVELLCMVIWRIWYIRNGMVHSSAIIHDVDVVAWAIACLDDYREANALKVNIVWDQGLLSDLLWYPPSVGVFKMNTDAAIYWARRRVGIRVIIRDCKGSVMASCTQKILAGYEPLIAEAMVVLKSLHFAHDSGL